MNSLKQLIQLLTDMADAHSRLLETAQEKRNILMADNVKELQRLLIRESTLIDEIENHERNRKHLVKELMVQKGYIGTSFTLEELLKMPIDTTSKGALQNVAKRLRLLIQEMTQLNEINQQLIQTSLSYVQYSIGMILPKEQPIGYGPNAKKRYSNLLDAKI